MGKWGDKDWGPRYDERQGPLKGWKGSPRVPLTEQYRGAQELNSGYMDSMGEWNSYPFPPEGSAMSHSRTPSPYEHLIDMSLRNQRYRDKGGENVPGGGVNWRAAQEAYERGLALNNEWHPVTRGGVFPYWPNSQEEVSKLRDPFYAEGEFGPWKP